MCTQCFCPFVIRTRAFCDRSCPYHTVSSRHTGTPVRVLLVTAVRVLLGHDWGGQTEALLLTSDVCTRTWDALLQVRAVHTHSHVS